MPPVRRLVRRSLGVGGSPLGLRLVRRSLGVGGSLGEVGSVVKNDPARASVVFQLQDLGWIRKYPGLDSNQGPKD